MIPENSKHILLADDDLGLRTMLALMLTGEGYRVSHAVTGREAVALHHQTPFDLVITELALDGFGVLMELRRHPSPPKFIAICRTNWMPVELCHRMGGQLGAHCVLPAPFPPEQLLSAVRGALG